MTIEIPGLIRAPDLPERELSEERRQFYRMLLLNKPLDFVLCPAAVVVHPNLIQENNNAKRRRISSHTIPDNQLASKFLKNANEDILLEIFVRFPDCRSATVFGSVCRLWRALISQPQFIPRFLRLHQDQSCTTILFRRNYYYQFEDPEYYQPVCKLFSNESLLLHGKHATSFNYFDFMPSPMSIRASFNDLLLVSPNCRSNVPIQSGPKYYICNPITKRWFLVPGEVPHGIRIGFALICMPNCSNELVSSTNAQYQYKVVLIHASQPLHLEVGVDCQTQVTVFCSKSGQWSQSRFSYPGRTKLDYTTAPKVVTCNQILYWMDSFEYHYRILALDLFNNHCGVICFPDDFDSISHVIVRLGVVRGELRLLQICRTGGSGTCFVMKVWELNSRDNSWVFVHKGNLTRPNADEKMTSVAFHPNNCDVVFKIWDMNVFEYRISKDTCHKLGELEESIGKEGLEPFPLVHPAWPTPVPSDSPSPSI